MKIKLRIFLVATIIILFSFSYVHAIDMFLTSSPDNAENNMENVTDNESDVVDENLLYEDLSNETDYSEDVAESEDIVEGNEENSEINDEELISSAPTTVTTQKSATVSNNSLGVSDIIDIILIAVCMVLIFLAVAILIRCK